MFDPASWGMNTRLTESSGLASPEAAEQWLIDWIVRVMDALNLPDKFLLTGWSMGGWMFCQYESKRPERVESLFLISPAGCEPYNPETYDPYKTRDPHDVS